MMDTGENLPTDVDVDITVGDTTAIYDVRAVPTRARYVRERMNSRSRAICAVRRDVDRLRDAFADGWDVGPALVHQERRLAMLVAADRKSR
jgi:hypothetical protein